VPGYVTEREDKGGTSNGEERHFGREEMESSRVTPLLAK
jgi:hypothetical protein